MKRRRKDEGKGKENTQKSTACLKQWFSFSSFDGLCCGKRAGERVQEDTHRQRSQHTEFLPLRKVLYAPWRRIRSCDVHVRFVTLQESVKETVYEEQG